jgi:hypothetical protein
MEVFGTIAWICLALIPGSVASKKGYSFWAYFLHGMFPSFITALITLNIAENMQYRHTDTPAVETHPTDRKPYLREVGKNQRTRQTPHHSKIKNRTYFRNLANFMNSDRKVLYLSRNIKKRRQSCSQRYDSGSWSIHKK